MLNPLQVQEFAERGFVLLPQVVPAQLLAAGTQAIDDLIAAEPPSAQARGSHFYWRAGGAERSPALFALLTRSGALDLAESLTGEGTLPVPRQVQVSLNIPPFAHRPGGPHLDGATPPEPSGRPGTFTLLAGILMSAQQQQDAGNLWVWPGTHLTHAAYFREHGPDAFLAAGGYPPIDLPEPEQVCGQAGDLLLAHFMLGHNMSGNVSPGVRRAVYFRLKRSGHEDTWREFLQDPWLDYDLVRTLRPLPA